MEQDAVSRECEARVGAELGGAWKLESLIGVGATSALYRASGPGASQVAVKCLHPHFSRHPELHTRFLRDAYIANGIEHVGSVKVLGDGVTERGEAYLVLELLKGASMKEHAQRHSRRLPVKLVLRVLDQLLSVLEKAHAAGMLHREIKPEHIFLTEEGLVKLIDFGIARLAEESGIANAASGVYVSAPAFMAPEQALGHRERVDARTDIWAAGATVFTLLTGRDVHDGGSAPERLVAAATRRAVSLGDVVEAPRPLVELVDTALAFEREQRFPTATAMRRFLRSAVIEIQAQRSSIQPASSSSATFPVAMVHGSGETRTWSVAPAGTSEAWRLMSVAPKAQNASPEPPLVFEDLEGSASVACSEAEIEALRALFGFFESGLTAHRRFTRNDDGADERFERVFGALTAVLASRGSSLVWRVTPCAFCAGNSVLWEPPPPLDQAISQLHAEGIRSFSVAPGVERAELQEFLRILSLGGAPGIGCEDDHVTLLWEASLAHVCCGSPETFAWVDEELRDSFERDVDSVIRLARFDTGEQLEDLWAERHGAQFNPPIAPIVKRIVDLLRGSLGPIDETRLQGGEGGESEANSGERDAFDVAVAIEPSLLEALTARMHPSEATLGDDFAIAIVHALGAVLELRDAEALISPLRAAIQELAAVAPVQAFDLVRALGAAVALDRDAVSNEVRETLAGSVVSSESLELMLKGVLATDADEEVWLAGLKVLLDGAADAYFDVALRAFVSAKAEGVKTVLLSYIRRVIHGHEHAVGQQFATGDVPAALALVRLLAKVDSEEAPTALGAAAQSPHAVVRIEALTHIDRGASEQLRAELRGLLEVDSLDLRLTALRSIADYGLRAAGPTLVLRVRDEGFDRLALDERRAILRAVSALAPARAESLALELLMGSRVVSSEAHEQTRGLAAEVLGRLGVSREALDALREAATKRWRNSERVRAVAGDALKQIERRHSLTPEATSARPAMVPEVGSGERHAVGRETPASGYLAKRPGSLRLSLASTAHRAPNVSAGARGEPIEERVLRHYAVALVTLRTFYDTVARGGRPELRPVKRVAQGLVSLSEHGCAAMLGMGALAHVHRDDAGRALQVAIHALALALQVTRAREVLLQLVLSALVAESGRVRLNAREQGELGTSRAPVPTLLPGLAAAACFGIGGFDAASALRTTVVFETAWLECHGSAVAVPFGGRVPLPQSLILAGARRLLDLRVPRGEAVPTRSPVTALVELATEQAVDQTHLRIALRAMGLPPAGTVVELETGEWGVVVAPASREAPLRRCRLRLVTDAAGRSLSPCPEVDLDGYRGASSAVRMRWVIDTGLARFNVARAFVYAPERR